MTVGGLVMDPVSGAQEMFGCKVPEAITRSWRVGTQKQVIGKAEILPVLMCAYMYDESLRDSRALIFIDNESARYAYIKGYSPSVASGRMLSAFWRIVARAQAYPWFERVPSASNVADAPSRLELEGLRARGVKERCVKDAFAFARCVAEAPAGP